MAKPIHVRWDCKYHIVIVPKCRRKLLFREAEASDRPILRDLCEQKKIELIEGHAMADHVHLCLSIPRNIAWPTRSVLKGRAPSGSIGNTRGSPGVGKHFWAEGYCVSTVGLDERQIRQYIQEQERFESGQKHIGFRVR